MRIGEQVGHVAMLALWGAIQALTVLGVLNYRRHIPRERIGVSAEDAVAIAAVRGPWPKAPAFVAGLQAPKLVLACSGEGNPAWLELARLAADDPAHVKIVAAGIARDEGQKIHKLRAAAAALPTECRYLVFLDTDIETSPAMIGRLLFPLARGKAEIASGYRLLLPPAAAPLAALVAAVDLQVATLPRPTRGMLPWGGATAITRATFERLAIRDAWGGRLSDDLTLARVARTAGVTVRPVRDLLVPSPMEKAAGAALRFGVRQYRHLFWNLLGVWLPAAAIALVHAMLWLWVFFSGGWPALAIGYVGAWARVMVRASIGRAVLAHADRRAFARVLAWDAVAPFAVSLAHAGFALAGAASRSITWGDFTYRMRRGGRVSRVTARRPSAGRPR